MDFHRVDHNAILPIARDAHAAIKKYRLLEREEREELKWIAISPEYPTLKNETVWVLGSSRETFSREYLSGQHGLDPLQSCVMGRGASQTSVESAD